MKNIAIFYASTTGRTKDIATEISKHLEEIKEYNIKVTGCEYIRDYHNIIFGISTYKDGEVQDDWKNIWNEFSNIDFTGKTVAIFGLGDQKDYPENFCDAMGTLYNTLVKNGAKVIGFTSSDDYNFKKSEALINDNFVGLALDLENQSELTCPRIENWVKTLKNNFK